MAEKWDDLFTAVGAHPKTTIGAGLIFFIVVLLICCLSMCSSLMYAFIEKKKVCGMKLLGGQFGCQPDATSKKCMQPPDPFANVPQYEGFEAEIYDDEEEEDYDDEQFDQYNY